MSTMRERLGAIERRCDRIDMIGKGREGRRRGKIESGGGEREMKRLLHGQLSR